MKYGTWNVSSCGAQDVAALCAAGFSPLTARVLCSRGFSTPDAVRDALRCDYPLCDPFALREMDRAVARIRTALTQGEKIAVYGDYDVDGITATCLLVDFLRRRGARCVSYIPGRLEEGYGLNETAIRQLQREQIRLIITVDCGITATAEAALCKELGIDLIITDHHECKEELPEACAVIDAHRRDRTYPHTDLSGVGVAFKLAAALSGDQAGVLEEYGDFVCLGTIADVMNLQGENRTFVSRGLQQLSHPRRVGVAALLHECGCDLKDVTASTVGYVLAPRINAAGRMGRVEIATDLFLTDNPANAARKAGALCRLNRQRQAIESEIYRDAVSRLGTEMPAAIVLAGENWHQGVVGIVASRMAEEYACPTFLICMDGDKGKASSRSYGGFNLFSGLSSLSGLLESYGGHELAAGFTIRRDRIDEFRERITGLARQFAASGEARSALEVDCAVTPELLTLENVEALAELEPCGNGCPRPVFCMEHVYVDQLSEVGSGKHLRLRLRAEDGSTCAAIFFSTTARQAAVAQGDCVDVAFTPQINEYRGVRTVQLNVVDLRMCRAERERDAAQDAVYARLCERGPISPQEAEQLLPSRSEFALVWRYLISHAAGGEMIENAACLCRKIAHATGRTCSLMRTRICLDAFHELGLIELRHHPKFLHIRITSDGRKVDLNQSSVVRFLSDHREGGK